MSKVLCIYHGNCMDGFSAAHAVSHAHPEAEFHKGVYGMPPPMQQINPDTEVIIVDFSYNNDWIQALCSAAATVTIIDHHLSFERQFPLPVHENLTVIFDKEHSGAWLAWDYYCGYVPRYVHHVEDRDLWKFQLSDTKELHAAMSCMEQTMTQWDILLEECVLGDLILDGTAILKYYNQQKSYLIEATKRSMVLNGINGLVCNAPPVFASDIGNDLAKESGTYGATYYQAADGSTKFSLRSEGDFDVSALAKLFGGGGHKNAAGFTISNPAGVADLVLWVPDNSIDLKGYGDD